MTETIRIRSAELSDLQAIGELCIQLGYAAELAGVQMRLGRVLKDPRQLLRVAINEAGAVIGWVHALPVCYLEADEFIEIGGLVVDAAYRKMGAGRRLMGAAEQWAKQSGFSVIRLRSNSKRVEAHQFYRSIGYQIVKEQYTFVKEL
jgi:GNAT superfamily N-acetyltransferase